MKQNRVRDHMRTWIHIHWIVLYVVMSYSVLCSPPKLVGKAEVSLPRFSRFVWLRIPDRLHLLQSSRLSKRCGTLSLELNVIGSEFASWRVISAAGEKFRILDDKIICRWVFCALNVLRLHFRTQKPSPNLTIFKKYSFV